MLTNSKLQRVLNYCRRPFSCNLLYSFIFFLRICIAPFKKLRRGALSPTTTTEEKGHWRCVLYLLTLRIEERRLWLLTLLILESDLLSPLLMFHCVFVGTIYGLMSAMVSGHSFGNFGRESNFPPS